MNALINPTTPATHITSWTWVKQRYEPVYTPYPDSAPVIEVCETTFEVAPPLYWVECANNVVAGHFYFDNVTQAILPVENVPMPNPPAISATEV